jgi:hypothetical protein
MCYPALNANVAAESVPTRVTMPSTINWHYSSDELGNVELGK